MKAFTLAFFMLASLSSFAQVQTLRTGENLTVKCPAGSQIVVTETNLRTANITCGSICRLEIGDECTWSNVNCSGFSNLYYIVLIDSNGKRTQLTKTDSSLTYGDVQSNLASQAQRIQDSGTCDSVKY